ncbi:MAG: hypothetical protein R3B48_12290 [Kofleriaceae bacterium]
MSASPSSRAFDALRPAIIARLLELRSSLDPALARSDEAAARGEIEAVLDDFSDYISTGDLATHRAFLAAFMAKRAAEELGPSAALSTLVAIGDTAVQVVQERVSGDHGDELALLVARVTTGGVRIINNLIAEQLQRHRALSHELRTGQRAGGGGKRGPRAESFTEPSPNTVPAIVYSSPRASSRSIRPPSGEVTDASTHPGTVPGTTPGTEPGAGPERANGRGARAGRRPSRTRR